ncbi:rod shape-determining protein MreC [Patescibacteria group bacterium]|nr:rod shape-determining protein MreC [Patescibacteria group bacterium]
MFRRDSKNTKYFAVLAGIVFLLVLIIFVFKSFPPVFATRAVFYAGQPFVFFKNKCSVFWENNLSVFRNKKELQQENDSLKQKVAEMESEKLFSEVILKENDEIKGVFSRSSDREFILAYVLSRPGYGIYNSLVIDAGFKQGVEEGMRVTAFGTVLLGYVSEVAPNASKVKLVSYPEEETNVFVGNNISAIAYGVGGENLSVVLPQDINVSAGDKITSLGNSPLFLGVVEKIIKEPADPFQNIIFRLPLNIQEITRVYLIKK